MTQRANSGRSATCLLLVGLLGALFWNGQGKSCSSKLDCQPEVSCHLVPWSCNSSDDTESTTTASPTTNPLNTRCCVHLGTCGGEVEVAGWVNVRNTSIELDGVSYSAEWLDTFITEGNATLPSVIKTAYVGSWSTLKQADLTFPSQMFVAEPTNSCTVDGDPKWPEWYHVTVNVVDKDNPDDTLDIENERTKDCLCDVEWDCRDNMCWVETQNMSFGGANLSKTNPDLEEKVAKFCRSSDNVTIANYTTSSSFATGFGPEQSQIDSFNFNTSVEGGWAPDLDDTDIWIQVDLAEDTIISGIVTQGVAVNPERRVDEFKIEYEASDAAAKILGGDTVFKAGARLDTKMTNSFPQPIKANRVKILISTPCDPYYVGLRFELLGCPVCETANDCTEFANGNCENEKFCTYEGPTTPAETTTARLSTAGQATTSGGATTKAPTPQASTVVPVLTSTLEATVTQTQSPIEEKINEVTQNLPPKVKKVVEDLLLVRDDLDGVSATDPTTYPTVNITQNTIKAGLEVIRNITVKANTTQDNKLQVDIIKGAWNFLAAVSTSDKFVGNAQLLDEFMSVSSLILDEDRKEAWREVQKESVAGPLGIVTSVEDVATKIASGSTFNINLTISEPNIEGLIRGKAKEEFVRDGYMYTFPKGDPNEVSTEVTILKDEFEDNIRVTNSPVNSSLVVVVLKFSGIEKILDEDDLQDKTPEVQEKKRVGSDILSISVVQEKDTISLPVTFKLSHDKPRDREDQRCSFWQPESKIIGVWSNKGCETSEKEPLYTKCSCDHMTNYAVLMWLGEKAPEDREAINILTKVGCLVSIAALALAVGLLLYLRSTLSSERIIIHMHLMTVTLIALLLFLVGIDKTENKLVCQFITIGLHFFYMSMFSWMLVEGIHLYRQIVAVFDSEKSRIWVYFALGWGIPIIVVGITSGIFFNQYKDHEICWLEVKDNSIWAFLGPIIPILLVNVAVLFMVLRIVMSAAKLQQEKPIFNSVKKGARSSLLLLPILGTTWIVGYFQHNLLSLQYVFVTLNAFQGFFMALFHCFMSGEVNSALKQKIRRVKESSLGGASTVDSSHKPAMFTSGIRKVKVAPSQTDNTDDF